MRPLLSSVCRSEVLFLSCTCTFRCLTLVVSCACRAHDIDLNSFAKQKITSKKTGNWISALKYSPNGKCMCKFARFVSAAVFRLTMTLLFLQSWLSERMALSSC